MLLETQRSNWLRNITIEATNKAQVTETYSQVCVFQLQDINQFLNEASVQDCVQVFLSCIGVDYNATTFSHSHKQDNTFDVVHYLHFNGHFPREPGPIQLSSFVLCIFFNAVTLLLGWQEGYLAHKKPVPLISEGSLPKKVEEEKPRENQLTRFPWKMAIKTEVSRYYCNPASILCP